MMTSLIKERSFPLKKLFGVNSTSQCSVMTLPSQDMLAQGSAATLSHCPRLTRRASSVQSLLSRPRVAHGMAPGPSSGRALWVCSVTPAFSLRARGPQPQGCSGLEPRCLPLQPCTDTRPPFNKCFFTRSKPNTTDGARIHSTVGRTPSLIWKRPQWGGGDASAGRCGLLGDLAQGRCWVHRERHQWHRR